MNDDMYYMNEALEEAKKAFDIKEVPIGCIIVYKDQVIGRGYNMRNTKKSTLAHAELLAIAEASEFLKDWRLEECEMYITLEPCPMCAGAIVQARIPKVIIGANNLKSGSAGSIINILGIEQFNHQVDIVKGVLEEECSDLLREFFKELRKNKTR
ncbi:tRNA adenosine(34) deaminase TadA [Natranaerovirga pectinivora]|nr:tRNA adenosine(34) deaminase TadA [Natranaerovirga pectinivora]